MGASGEPQNKVNRTFRSCKGDSGFNTRTSHRTGPGLSAASSSGAGSAARVLVGSPLTLNTGCNGPEMIDQRQRQNVGGTPRRASRTDADVAETPMAVDAGDASAGSRSSNRLVQSTNVLL
jgi:hypothetical protein